MKPTGINLNKKYKTVDGRDVLLICKTPPEIKNDYPVLGYIVEDGDYFFHSWNLRGENAMLDIYNLVEVHDKVTVYIYTRRNEFDSKVRATTEEPKGVGVKILKTIEVEL